MKMNHGLRYAIASLLSAGTIGSLFVLDASAANPSVLAANGSTQASQDED